MNIERALGIVALVICCLICAAIVAFVLRTAMVNNPSEDFSTVQIYVANPMTGEALLYEKSVKAWVTYQAHSGGIVWTIKYEDGRKTIFGPGFLVMVKELKEVEKK